MIQPPIRENISISRAPKIPRTGLHQSAVMCAQLVLNVLKAGWRAGPQQNTLHVLKILNKFQSELFYLKLKSETIFLGIIFRFIRKHHGDSKSMNITKQIRYSSFFNPGSVPSYGA